MLCANTNGRIACNEIFKTTHQVDATFGQHYTALEQHRSQLVDQRRSRIDQALPHTVQDLQV